MEHAIVFLTVLLLWVLIKVYFMDYRIDKIIDELERRSDE